MKNIFLDFIIPPLKMVGFVKHVSFPLNKRTKNRPIIEVRRSSTNQWLIEPFTLNQKLIFKLLTGVIFNKRDWNWIRTQNHLVLKRTLNHLAKLALND